MGLVIPLASTRIFPDAEGMHRVQPHSVLWPACLHGENRRGTLPHIPPTHLHKSYHGVGARKQICSLFKGRGDKNSQSYCVRSPFCNYVVRSSLTPPGKGSQHLLASSASLWFWGKNTALAVGRLGFETWSCHLAAEGSCLFTSAGLFSLFSDHSPCCLLELLPYPTIVLVVQGSPWA